MLEGWAKLGFSEAAFLGEVGLSVPAGEKGRSVLEQTWSRPTCEVNGMTGGYTGDGFKTVIPAVASAKISFRLVFDQDPHKIRAAFREFVKARVPADCRVEFTEFGSGRAVAFEVSAPAFQNTQKALSDEWGKEAAFVGGGGSIPVTTMIKEKLGMDVVMAGFGLSRRPHPQPEREIQPDQLPQGHPVMGARPGCAVSATASLLHDCGHQGNLLLESVDRH